MRGDRFLNITNWHRNRLNSVNRTAEFGQKPGENQSKSGMARSLETVVDLFFSIAKYLFIGFFSLLGFVIVLAIVFGDRIKKKWEYEAEFHDARGREFAEFDIEMSRVEKKEPNYSLKAKFKMRHTSLAVHTTVQIFLDQLLILEGMVKEEGRIRLNNQNLKIDAVEAQAGQMCRVICGGQEILAQEIVPDGMLPE